MHVLLATDADWIVDEVTAALDDAETRFTVCREGRAVVQQVTEAMLDGMATLIPQIQEARKEGAPSVRFREVRRG